MRTSEQVDAGSERAVDHITPASTSSTSAAGPGQRRPCRDGLKMANARCIGAPQTKGLTEMDHGL
jgi:hypothetical protein